VSERGGHPVVQKKMRQWCLRVSAYAQRLLDGLETVDWTDSLKETQRNWIGRSEGTEVRFKVKDSDLEFTIFTTRADTMFGVTFMVLAPESELVPMLTTEAQRAEVEAYLDRTKKRTERERIADRRVTGVFSGSYAVNPFTGESVPVWISDYVLAGYGTGAIMAVPAHDSRDYAFAKHFNLPIVPMVEGCDVSEESFYQRYNRQVEMFGKCIVTTIVRRYRHDGSCSITSQYIITNPYWNRFSCKRIYGIRTTEHTRYTTVSNTLTFCTLLCTVQISLNFCTLCFGCQHRYQFTFRCKYHESHTEHRIGTRSKDSKFQIAVFYLETYFSTF
jgi:isoleucyl-tRNA synthetase